jgi:hypothetical protein
MPLTLTETMDIDQIEEAQAAAPLQPRRTFTVPVDDAHPFDLEGYISNYSGEPNPCPSAAEPPLNR